MDAYRVDFREVFADQKLVGDDVPYALGTYCFAAGAALRWFRDEFGAAERRLADELVEDDYRVLDRDADGLPPGSEG